MNNSQNRHIEVAIMGSGFSGLCMAIRLKEAQISSFVIFESAAELGGTWRDNSYPGCGCDVPSHLYSFSFFPKNDWSRVFSGHAEIFAYMQACAAHYELEPYFRFGTGIAEATFLEAEGLWELRTHTGEVWTAHFLVGATGGLSDPFIPELSGRESFVGPQFHSQGWDHSLDLKGKQVAVIGTGASAIQFVPLIAEKVSALHLFQRTPPWVLKKPDHPFSKSALQRFRKWPGWRLLYRRWLYWKAEFSALGFIYWPSLMRAVQPAVKRLIKKSVQDHETARALLPNYRLGCKRVLMSNTYYPTFNKDHVHLITNGIAQIEAEGIRTQNGKLHKADILIFATGFKATEYLSQVTIRGRKGKTLSKTWEENGGEAYLGTTVAGFPNLFMYTGPNTGLGHTSMVYMIESQAKYILDAIQKLRGPDRKWAEVKPNIQAQFNVKLQKRLARTVWQSGGCQSWYQMKTGKNTTLWPYFTFIYRWKTRQFDHKNYLQGTSPQTEINEETPKITPHS
ncbi:MAG TPA: NAD(P)/FAD-dependent oxidoreductase [Bacteroidetes bacterium]|nr:NAD(P)/FAD-dependent oxidoreductase [Bacteroidota bacterium]